MILDIFQYDFMRRAFIVGILLAVIIPCIGVIVVFKRLSLIGDALSHTSLAGVAIGLSIVNGMASVTLYLRQVKNARNVFCMMRADEAGEIEITYPWDIR